MAGTNACLLARARLSQFVGNLKTSSATTKFTTGVKAGYLWNIKSTLRNITGNTSQAIANQVGHNITAAIDYTQALVVSAAKGGAVRPHELRTIASTWDLPGLKAGAHGIRDGVAQGVEIMRTGINAEKMAEKFDHEITHYDNPIMEAATKGIFNFLEAQDKPFYNFALQTSLYSRAKLAGIRAGLKGKGLTQYIDGQLASPTEDMMLGAHADAAYATYKNPTLLSEMASSARNKLKQGAASAEPGRRIAYAAGQVGLELTMPFTKVAGAIANMAVDYSPAGFLKAVALTMDKDPRAQAEFRQRLGRATIGTGLMLWGMNAAKNGNATGAFPTNSGERRRWDMDGRGANMVKFNGEWHSITILGPLAIPFLLGANLQAAGEMGWKERAALGGAFMGKTLTEMTFLSSVSNLVDALTDPKKGAAQVAASYIAPMPSAVSQVAQSIDPVQRQSKGVKEKIQAKIPGLSKRLPARLGAFGDTVSRPGGWRAIADPTAGRKVSETEITKELQRLEVNPGAIGTKFTIDGKHFERTREEVNELTLEFGPIKRAVLEAIMKNPEYMSGDADLKKQMLEHGIREVTNAANGVDKGRRSGEKIPKMTPEEFLSGAIADQ